MDYDHAVKLTRFGHRGLHDLHYWIVAAGNLHEEVKDLREPWVADLAKALEQGRIAHASIARLAEMGLQYQKEHPPFPPKEEG
jgi:hypothetical protein